MKLEVPPGYKLMDNRVLVPETVPPPEEKDGWGEVVGLRAGLTVWNPEGKLLHNKDWRARSFTRWFGMWVRAFFDGTANPTVTNALNGSVTLKVNSNATGMASGTARLVPTATAYTNTFDCGAGLAIGTGALGEVSGQYALKTLAWPASYYNPGAGVYSSVTTTTMDTSQIVFTVTEGYTAGASGWSITEIGLLISCQTAGQTTYQAVGNPVLMAYDTFTAVVVPAGGVVCPRYTLTFTA